MQHCKDAIDIISRENGIKLTRVSSFYKSEPVGIENQDWFVNAVIEIKTELVVRDLMKIMQRIENMLGRKRQIKGGPRTIDLDILFYGQDVIAEPDLIVPHPEIHKRRFVLEPLNEIASYFIHPGFGVSVRGLKDRLDDQKIVECISPSIPISMEQDHRAS